MGKEEIVARILSDAEREAEAIVAEAQNSADEAIGEAKSKAAALKAETEEEIAGRAKRISEGKAAAARLDSSKRLLAEKRRVIDEIYRRAAERLLSLGEHDSLALISRLLKENGEAGDEVEFAADYPYAEKAARLPVLSEMGLKVSAERTVRGGGFVLHGKVCDKDVTFSALLARDRAEHEPALAAKLFK